MLRESFKSELEKCLNSNSFFSYFDFEVIEDEKGVVSIEFLTENKYYFNFKIPTSTSEFEDKYEKKYSEYYYKTTISPWISALSENVNFIGKNALFSGIKEWMKYLQEDLLSIPVNRKIQEHENKLNEINEIIETMNNDYLSEDEKEQLVQRIDQLEQNMIKSINELNKKVEEKESLIQSLKSEFEALKEKTEIYNKKNFFKTFAAKIVQWTSDPNNQKILGSGITIVRNLIENKKD